MKWEPVLAMVALVLLGAWLVAAPSAHHELRDGARVIPFSMGPAKGDLEVAPDDPPTYRLLVRGEEPSPVMTREQMVAHYGEPTMQRVDDSQGHALFRVLNITSWVSLVWVLIGFGGQIAFFGRMAIQWVVSESKKQSVIPTSFWWLSLVGGIALFTYFVWRKDIVGVMGQSTGVIIYARNLRLIHKRRKRDRRAARRARQTEQPGPIVESKAEHAEEPINSS